jgi:hypothetical protein
MAELENRNFSNTGQKQAGSKRYRKCKTQWIGEGSWAGEDAVQHLHVSN